MVGDYNVSDSIIESTITLPQSIINKFDSELRYLLTWYNTSILLQLSLPLDANASDYNFTVDSEVLGFTIPEEELTNTSDPVILRFQSIRSRSGMVSIYFVKNVYY